jgi:Base plate wedge protein 53
MAIKLFADYPQTSYTLDNNLTEQVVVDIFRRIVLSKEYRDNSVYFEEYEVLHGETPEQISYRFYGTQDLHWLILMVNDIIDPRFEWPVSEENLYKSVSDKYGGDKNVFTINSARNKAGQQVETYFILTEESTYKNPSRLLFESNDTNSINTPIAFNISPEISDYVSNFEVEETKNESYRLIKVLKQQYVQDILNSYKSILAEK